MLWAVAVAGALGALGRYLLEGVVQERSGAIFPAGTLVVNLSGSLVLGLLAGLVLYHGLGRQTEVVLGTGFLGAYTTFSTYSYETVRLLAEGSRAAAVANGAGGMAAGLLAAAAGLGLAAVL